MLPHDERGEGEAVVLLHAGVADRTMWREHLEWLAEEGFRAIALDLRGFGEAEIPPDLRSWADWEDVLQTMRELEVGQATLVGNSYGAGVALRVAVVAPAAVSGLVLISPGPLHQDPSPELEAAWAGETAALERGDIEGAVAAVLDAWLLPEAPPALRHRVAAMQRRAFEVQQAAEDIVEPPDPLERHAEALEALAPRVLAAAGERDMSDFKRGAEQIAGLVPRGAVRSIPGAGHLAPLESPAEFRALLTGFLRDRDVNPGF